MAEREGDVVERAKAALEGVTEGPWETSVHAMPGATVDEWYVREITHTFDPNMHRLNVLKVRGATHAARQCCWPPTVADAEFIASARSLVPELIAEVERLRSYKSLPLDMVWQDYYSPDDVLKIRQPLDAEIEQLRAEVVRLRAQETRIRELCAETEDEKWRRKIARAFDGSTFPHMVRADDVLAALDTEGEA
ncbi:hypothetical protein SEA_FANCYPANTS_93 [Mycobacterium phage Fancypants]|uniref:Uncharacterized protein n=1 Tax=Mycobacterium phage Fancypants TaxID=2530128 RepID=A0A481VU36_9CAUD|nr:hypothetical protein I5H36_gp093 [Mycobacterium phage Fancypants]QBI97429.1 hypothetical protein SEA_FANCYPANTS_93 [Mycobacterium phage Fancypants]